MRTKKNLKKVIIKSLPAISYYELKSGVANSFEYPPIPMHLQTSIKKCIKKYGEDSDEFVVLAEDIVFIGKKWTRMYINW